METYTFLRQFADSWMLLALTLVFVGVVFWVFRPGSRVIHDDAADMIFRHEEQPIEDSSSVASPKEARK